MMTESQSIPTIVGELQGPDDWEEADIPEPPNGGWGWMIVLASFLCNTIVDGIAYTFGIFLIEFVGYYGTSKGETAWVGSLLSGMYMSVGPLVSALTNSFGCRPVTIAGSLLSCAAFLLSTIAPNVGVLMFTYGIMGGFGFGLIYLPAIVSVSYYFSTKRAFATGIAVCGSGMGAFTFAPLCQKLLEIYDWKNALMILAGISFNCAVFGALMRPLDDDSRPRRGKRSSKPEVPNTEPGVQSSFDITNVGRSSFHVLTPLKESPTGSTEDKAEFKTLPSLEETLLPNQEQNPNGDTTVIPIENFTLLNPRTTRRKTVGPCLTGRKLSMIDYPTESLNVPPHPKLSVSTALMGMEGWQAPRRLSLMDRKDLHRPLYRKDIFYSGSIRNLKEFQKSNNDVRTYVASITSIPPLPSVSSPSLHEKKSCIPRTMQDTLSQMLDFKLLKDYSFLLLCMVNVLGMMGYYIPFVYITDNAIHQGISRSKAVYLISVIGITNIVGRLIFGWLSDMPKISALYVNNVCLLASGVATMCLPYCHNYALALTACSCFGVFISAYISLTSIILVELLGLEKLTNSFGLLCLFRGAASIAGPPIAGTILDMTGSYELTFLVAALLLISSGVLTFLVPWVKHLTTPVDPEKPLVESSPSVSGEPIGALRDNSAL